MSKEEERDISKKGERKMNKFEDDDKKKRCGATLPFQIVVDYFNGMEDLFAGDSTAIKKLMSLWAQDGILVLTGAPGESEWPRDYKGSRAVQSRYADMLNMQKQQFKLADAGSTVTIDSIDFCIESISLKGDVATVTLNAGVTTSKKPAIAFDYKRTFTFTFDKGKIQQLVEHHDWSSAAEAQIERISAAGLSVKDIGRLTLAAWAIA